MDESNAICELAQSQQVIQVYIRLYDGNGCLLNLSTHSTVSTIIDMINSSKLSVPSPFRLIHAGEELNQLDSSLSELSIRNNSIIHVESVMPESAIQLKIDVKVYHNKDTFTLRVSTSDTVLQLKKRLGKLIGVMPRQQKIVFRGENLRDEQRIEEYYINSNSLLCLKVENTHLAPIKVTQAYVFEPNENILDSATSYRQGKPPKQQGGKQAGALFRSEVAFKPGQSIEGFELSIRQQQDQDSLENCKDFKFDLFTSQPIDLLPKSMPLMPLLTNGKLKESRGQRMRETNDSECEEELSRLSEESVEGDEWSFEDRMMVL